MAESCRPVSRHGRYNASGPSSVQYTSDVSSYGNVDYKPSDEMYTVTQPSRPERPKTSHGRRKKTDIPPRPSSRRGHQVKRPDPDEESYGRPISRVGYSPEAEYRYSHDEYSRQISLETETKIQNSPNNSPEPDDILYHDQLHSQALGFSPASRDFVQNNTQGAKTDRLIVSPSAPSPRSYRQSPQGHRESPKGYRQSSQGYAKSPQGFRQSPHGFGQSPRGYRQSPQFARPSSRDNINVSPIQRDEAQISDRDLHHMSSGPLDNGQMDVTDADRYLQRFQESPPYGTSPYRDSPQYSPHVPTSPSEQQTYTRPLPSQRPKSARPKTGRKKSARARHRHEEQETSQPQFCDTSSILNVGDPYGRPSSSLSPYKPLPAIGQITPRNPPGSEASDYSESVQGRVDRMTMDTQRLVISNESEFHPVDNDYDTFTAEDIQGASSNNQNIFSGVGVPNVDMLTNLPQHLSEEIYEKSVLNFERNVSGEDGDIDDDSVPVNTADRGKGSVQSENSASDGENKIRSAEAKPLSFLHELPDEPQPEEDRILLAIKLPDGKRIQRHFRPKESLEIVLHFAENSSLTDFSEYWLVCNAPKLTFVDLLQKIADTPIKDRTVLYLEEKD